jgi:hypothetical protein
MTTALFIHHNIPETMPILRRLRAVAVTLLVSLALVRPAAAVVDRTDIYWNPAESGWGVNFIMSNTFMFATFFIYGLNGQPFWVTANMTEGANGVWSGPLYQTAGTFYGAPWNPGQQTTVPVGTATFTPTNSFSGTLTYNVGTTTVVKQIQRQTLTTTPMGGSYSGAVQSIFTNCNDPNLNGPERYFTDVQVTQNASGAFQLAFETLFGPVTITGTLVQNGLLYRLNNAAYTNAAYLENTTFTSTAQVTDIKPTQQGLEGTWVAPMGSAFPGCIETAYFSVVFL